VPVVTRGSARPCSICVFAEFDTNLRRERQLEGIANRRRLQGTASFDRSLAGARTEGAGHAGPSDIAKALKIGRASVCRVLGQKADR
jgi:DNA invertase Pin-like site-specific DNA recombinase